MIITNTQFRPKFVQNWLTLGCKSIASTRRIAKPQCCQAIIGQYLSIPWSIVKHQQHSSRLLLMKFYCVSANDNDDSIEFKGRMQFSKFPVKTHYLALGRSKVKAAHSVNYYSWILGQTIKNCPTIKLYLFIFLLYMNWLIFASLDPGV